MLRRRSILVVLSVLLVLTPASALASPLTREDQIAVSRHKGAQYAEGAAVSAFLASVQAEKDRAEAARNRRDTQRPAVSAPQTGSVGSGGHDPCAEPISGLLPSYIVQRESRGDCGAYNHGGCGGRGCLGWAQIDEGHFSANSPWGPGPGSCYGLSYNGCVSKLSNGGTNLSPWRCC